MDDLMDMLATDQSASEISDKIKEILSRLHNTFLSYVETTIEYEKLLKEDFISYFAKFDIF